MPVPLGATIGRKACALVIYLLQGPGQLKSWPVSCSASKRVSWEDETDCNGPQTKGFKVTLMIPWVKTCCAHGKTTTTYAGPAQCNLTQGSNIASRRRTRKQGNIWMLGMEKSKYTASPWRNGHPGPPKCRHTGVPSCTHPKVRSGIEGRLARWACRHIGRPSISSSLLALAGKEHAAGLCAWCVSACV
ncbi:hypothetical protein LX32DRAFT_17973 [Colletotrichum zoysiae]|uniref:Uncharacterized protein n=1 Tax=Colletotrichum zoysiae TaxID=1216348 RepID=A0AAD9HCT9_9PEZI|nr:hypothetical protein LX32DRAFT_17973 [Colletotrichum zoysiae]